MIQIDIALPKCCDECFALDGNRDYPNRDYPFCLITQDQRGYTFKTGEMRMSSCPLKEVKTNWNRMIEKENENGNETENY